jgi:hypothetical protein
MSCEAVTACGWSTRSVILSRPEPARRAPPPACTCACAGLKTARDPGAVSSVAAGHFPGSPLAVEHGPDPRGKLMPGEALDHILVGAKPWPRMSLPGGSGWADLSGALGLGMGGCYYHGCRGPG